MIMKRPGGFDGPASLPEPTQRPVIALRQSKSRLSGTDKVNEAASVQNELATAFVAGITSSTTTQQNGLGSGDTLTEQEREAVEPVPDTGRQAEVRQAREKLKLAERQRRKREKKEQRRFTEHVRMRRRRRAVGVIAVLGLAAFVSAGVFTPIMAVHEIEIDGAESVNIETLRQALSGFEGVPLALVSDQDIHKALEPFPLIQRYAVERIPPHTLVVRVEERSPVLAFASGKGFDLLDAAGVLVTHVSSPDQGIPTADATLSDTSSAQFRAAAAIVRDMPRDIRDQLAKVRAESPQEIIFTLVGGTEVIWGDTNQTQRKAIVLRSVLAAVGEHALIDVTAPEAPVFR